MRAQRQSASPSSTSSGARPIAPAPAASRSAASRGRQPKRSGPALPANDAMRAAARRLKMTDFDNLVLDQAAGVFTATTSPFLTHQARAMGELTDSLPILMSASSRHDLVSHGLIGFDVGDLDGGAEDHLAVWGWW